MQNVYAAIALLVAVQVAAPVLGQQPEVVPPQIAEDGPATPAADLTEPEGASQRPLRPADPDTGQSEPEVPRKAAPTAEQIRQWIQDLDADVFVVREKATEKLVEAGPAVLEPLAAALAGSGLEVTTRAISVLRELALAGDLDTQEAAREALQNAAEMRGTAAARRAAATLNTLDDVRQGRAIEELESLGARFETVRSVVGFQFEERFLAIEINDKWRGQEQDLRRLKSLRDAQRVTFEGPQVADSWLKHLDGMKNLRDIVLKRAPISDEGLNHLRHINGLQELSLMYLPVGDGAVEHLQIHQGLSALKLFGTEITKEGAQKLQQSLVGTKVDHRHGAFLGVGCQPHQQGCAVVVVHPDSAADQGGLAPGDVILSYGGKAAPDFETLTALIAENHAGDVVEMEVLRGAEKLTKTVMLGQWE